MYMAYTKVTKGEFEFGNIALRINTLKGTDPGLIVDWYKDGVSHRDNDLPAKILFDIDGNPFQGQWFQNGQWFRADNKPNYVFVDEGFLWECWFDKDGSNTRRTVKTRTDKKSIY